MNDKKEPFNAVGDPFFKQVGEEHVEVAEEGAEVAVGTVHLAIVSMGTAESPGTNSGFCGEQWGLLGPFSRTRVGCCSVEAALLLQRCNAAAMAEPPAFSSRSRHLWCNG